MYYYRWTPDVIEALDEPQLLEAYQNLVWARQEEAKASQKKG